MVVSYLIRWTLGLWLLCIPLMTFPQLGSSQSLTTFDPIRVAHYETKMWQAYYDDDFYALLTSLVELLSEQYQLSIVQTLQLSQSAALSAKTFADMPSNTQKKRYKKEVLPEVLAFFKQLHYVLGGTWDPKQVAEAELEWWIDRRNPRTSDPKKIGKKIARVYTLFYGIKNEAIERAGYLRAKAAHLRGQQRQKGQVDWVSIQKLLEESYSELKRGIHHSKGRPK